MDAVTLLLALLAVGVLILVHEAGHYFAAKWSGMSVRRFSIGFGPAIAKIERDGTEFQIGPIPLGGYVQIDGMNPHDGSDPHAPTSYLNRPFHQRFAAVLAGPAANYLLGFVLFFGIFVAFHEEPIPPVVVVDVLEGSASAEAGLQAGDRIVGVGGSRFEEIAAFGAAIDDAKGAPIPFDVSRDGTERVISVTPRPVDGGGYRIGIRYDAGGLRSAPMSVTDAFGAAWREVVNLTVGPVLAISAMIRGQLGLESFSGPVGMVRGMMGDLERSWVRAVRTVARFSIGLGVINLLPIPALDGSRLLFLLVGVIRRRPVEPKIETIVHLAGFVFLLGLLLVVSVFDILR